MKRILIVSCSLTISLGFYQFAVKSAGNTSEKKSGNYSDALNQPPFTVRVMVRNLG